MHMNSAPHLLNEDRAEFARILDEALRTANYRPEQGSAAGKHLNTEQLRTMALSATTAIAACATAEYQHYVKLREELRAPAPAPSAVTANGGTNGAPGTSSSSGGTGPAEAVGSVGEVTQSSGAGLAAMITVLAPVLAAIAAVLFLLVGYVLRTLGPDRSAAQPMISVGWVFAALAVAGFLVAMTGLIVTALRNGSTSTPAKRRGSLAREVDLARDAWRQALLERGLLPFLREALADPPSSGASGTSGSSGSGTPGPSGAPGSSSSSGKTNHDSSRYVPQRGSDGESRISPLGYTRPNFTSPDGGPPAGPRPHFTSPGFTSPDYGGPDHQPE
ncbi:hypothetical protein [Streptomyces sp. MST-110588]|uniref:hypothetical protein n=1 Tax=Streptomyces sp. MST-110588 TaxID=2833628 RepID=UPI001F5D23AA|nr:hypothetical protein [Streptomyces sp. MST-110588]UNO40907.1 hypothetical protein KGS77_16650 [Streptomyces sp. MST-110588]